VCECKLDKMHLTLNKYKKLLTIFFILTYLIVFLNQSINDKHIYAWGYWNENKLV